MAGEPGARRSQGASVRDENSYLSPRARLLAAGRRGRGGPARSPPLESGLAAAVTLSPGTELLLPGTGTGGLGLRVPPKVWFCCF